MHLTHASERDRPIADAPKPTRRRGAINVVRIGLATAVSAMAAGAAAGPAFASPQRHATRYEFRTLDNRHDVTFNQLLGINRSGAIAGYFGSGAQDHPNKGYLLFPRFHRRDYLNANFPGSVQTQVTGLNDRGVTVGFWSDSNKANPAMNANFGFYSIDGHFYSVNFPTTDSSTPPMNQLLGVNDRNVAVGFYNDSAGNSHGYTYSIRHNRFNEIIIPGATSLTAAAINNRGDVAGFETDAMANVHGYLLERDGDVTTLDVPGATMTQALGVNDEDEVVGVYQDGTDSNATMHGFTWTPWRGFQTVDDPNGIGATTVNGVNDEGQLVGFYTDGNGNTDGLLATPQQHDHH